MAERLVAAAAGLGTGPGAGGDQPLSYRAKISVDGVGVGWNDTSLKPAWASQDR